MDLKDFLSLIELAAGLNAAYIVVGIYQGYTNKLLNNVFNIKQLIDSKFNPIKETINFNRITLDNTEPSEVNGKNTNTQIEKVKRSYEVLCSKITKIEQDIEVNANIACEFRCFSGLSLMMFLYCCTLLFVAPFYSNCFLFTFTGTVFIHSVYGWFKENMKCVCNLMWVIFEFIIFLILSSIVCAISYYTDFKYDTLNNKIFVIINNILIIISALLPMVNFIIFFLKSYLKIKKIKKDINKHATDLEEEVNKTHKNFDLLQGLEQLKMVMLPN